jgi:hypothetical protein
MTSPLTPTPKLSVVMTNFNYARFVGPAIESALAIEYPDVQVIVVDDGSSDGSQEVIARYQPRITALFQDNRGQIAATNRAFELVTGDVVVFLDGDDTLDPAMGREIAAAWGPAVSKVQFQMKIIDGDGRPTGAVFPLYPGVPTPAQIRTWASRAAAYPTPPGSGNAYSRWFLQRLFPLAGTETAPDSYCLAAAPHLGDVVTVARPLASYRVHGRNQGAMLSFEPERLARELGRAQWRFRYAQQLARSAGVEIPDAAFRRSLATLPYRLASLRLAAERHPIPHDTIARVVLDTVRAALVPQGRSAPAVAALVAWTILVALLPETMGKQLALWRFASPSRPKLLRRALSMFRVVG